MRKEYRIKVKCFNSDGVFYDEIIMNRNESTSGEEAIWGVV